MNQIIVVPDPLNPEDELERLARRYKAAGGMGIQVLNTLGTQADGLLNRLPVAVQDQLTEATRAALTQALGAASRSRGVVPDQAEWLNATVSAAMGAAGGFGGLPTALAELPVTTTLLLRVIEGVAEEYGFDASTASVRFDCIQVFAAAGPLEHDDGSDIAFLSARMALSGAAMQAMITRIAPRLAVVLGQKLAAQTVPVLGAAAGAAINFSYTKYYTDMAHVHFGLRRLSVEADQPHEAMVERLRTQVLALKAQQK
ncbi:EcsC family protein [Tateyamaria omphalii]|uniref:Protein EcsC n=1 Tax=Tateyamaria omphalii TaxID=299262 RepID=A0A1P8N0G0_9RHOB|nr:EcsC family protein [Tateyamaria omphalii]APX13817.1 protein EcsC [Tateyamaria omphalii]